MCNEFNFFFFLIIVQYVFLSQQKDLRLLYLIFCELLSVEIIRLLTHGFLTLPFAAGQEIECFCTVLVCVVSGGRG